MVRSLVLARLRLPLLLSRHVKAIPTPIRIQSFSSNVAKDSLTVEVSKTKIDKPKHDESFSNTKNEKELKSACGDVEDDDDDEMEQEEMFVDAHESFEHQGREWGGPRRGGRFPEPTRFGDWERKGRCSDF